MMLLQREQVLNGVETSVSIAITTNAQSLSLSLSLSMKAESGRKGQGTLSYQVVVGPLLFEVNCIKIPLGVQSDHLPHSDQISIPSL